MDERAGSTEGLQSVRFLRRELGNHLRLRNTPILHFHWDPSLAHAEHINQLLDKLDIPAEEEE